MARVTPLAEAASHYPAIAVFAAGGFLTFLFCLIVAAPYADRWIAALIRRHARRIGHALGAENRRIDEWTDEIAPRPAREGRT